MKTVTLTQGTPEWHAHRAQHFNASDAPAMMSCSPYKTRQQLVIELATGIIPEVDGHTQRRFDEGHHFEVLARPLAEAIIGDELYPVVGTNGKYSASFDGLTLMEDVAFEHKRLNRAIKDVLTHEGEFVPVSKALPMYYRVQMEHQLMVAGEASVLFMATDWEKDDSGEWVLKEKRACWYEADLELRAQIVEGWKLLEADVAVFDPAKYAPAPKLLGTARAALPALLIDARGEIAASNLDDLKAIAVANINSINTTLETDQQFADAEADAKWLRDVSKAMKAGLDRVRAGMKSVDEVMSTLENLDKMAAAKALDLEKRVKSEKDARKMALVMETKDTYSTLVDGLNQSLGADYIPYAYDFAPHIKGLKTLDSMRDKLSAALAEQIAKARALSENFRANNSFLHSKFGDESTTAWNKAFSDFRVLGGKPPQEFQEIAAGRIAKWKEEQATARAEAKALQDAQDAIAQAATANSHTFAIPVGATVDMTTYVETSRPSTAEPIHIIPDWWVPSGEPVTAIFAVPAPSSAVPVVDTGATIALGQLSTLLYPAKFDAAGLGQLGFLPVATAKGAKLYRECDIPAICRAVIKHMESVLEHHGKARLTA